MALLAGALLIALRLQRRPTVGGSVALGVVVALSYTIRPVNAVAVVAFGLWCVTARAVSWRGYVVGGALVAAPWMLISWLSFGQLLPPYHSGGRLGLHGHMPEAIAANLVSPSRGLLVFAPVTIVAAAGVWLRARNRELDGLDGVALLIFFGYLCIVSAFKSTWWAGHSIGPRFLTDALPALAFLSVAAVDSLVSSLGRTPVQRRVRVLAGLVTICVAWSVFVNASGAVFRATNCWNLQPVNVDLEPSRIWSWSDPQFLAGPRAVLRDGLVGAVRGTSCASLV